MRPTTGFTLWELLCTLAIAGVALGVAVPTFSEWVLDGRRTADVNGFVLAVQLARSEAAKRGSTVIVCSTADTFACGRAGLFTAGWMVFVNLDERRPPSRSATEPLLLAHAAEVWGSITSNRPFYEFRPLLHRSTNGTVVFCDARGSPAAKAVIVSYTGRPRVDAVDPDRRALVCADLP